MIGPIMHDEEVFATSEVTCVGQVGACERACNVSACWSDQGPRRTAGKKDPRERLAHIVCTRAIPSRQHALATRLLHHTVFITSLLNASLCLSCLTFPAGHRRRGRRDRAARPARSQGREGKKITH